MPYKNGDEADASTPKKVNNALIEPKLFTPYISAHSEFDIFSVKPLENPRPAI
jgi:hypothetical protein|tara:strand:- start:31 stop:189 length:159 start_codon:yes stop_codon:yes gene_type:complete